MTYQITVSQLNTPELFRSFKKYVDNLADKYQTKQPDDLKKLLEQELSVSVKISNQHNYHEYQITFTDQKKYLWFLLQWAHT